MTEELPAAGETSPPAWRPTATESPGTVSLTEAAELWQVSERTLRRRLGAGEVPGAHKVPTSKGEEWRLPAGALDALGYERTDAEVPGPAVPAVEADALLQELREDRQAWRDLATEARRELQAAESDRKAAEAERLEALTTAARLEERLAAAEARADALAVELAEARKPRRRWRR